MAISPAITRELAPPELRPVTKLAKKAAFVVAWDSPEATALRIQSARQRAVNTAFELVSGAADYRKAVMGIEGNRLLGLADAEAVGLKGMGLNTTPDIPSSGLGFIMETPRIYAVSDEPPAPDGVARPRSLILTYVPASMIAESVREIDEGAVALGEIQDNVLREMRAFAERDYMWVEPKAMRTTILRDAEAAALFDMAQQIETDRTRDKWQGPVGQEEQNWN